MNIVLVVLALMVVFLIIVQAGQWRMQVLPVYILPFGALAVVVAAAGAIIAQYEGDILAPVWMILAILQGVYLAVLSIGSLLSE